jgi:DNA-binding NarL/FixJ family response regulator
MPIIKLETFQSITRVQEVVTKYIPDPIIQYRFFRDLQKSLCIDEKGKVSFKPYLLSYRRRSVDKLFSGENHEEVAKTLGISVDTVKNDVRHNYENHQKKK